MNSSDERNRTIRGMQLLGLSFPPDLARTAKTIEELPVEYMLCIKSVYADEFTVYNRLFDSLSKRITFQRCDICEVEEMAYDDLPKGWGWYDGQVQWYLLCNDCQARYEEKFNKPPVIVREI